MNIADSTPTLVEHNPELVPYTESIRNQWFRYQARLHEIEAYPGGLLAFADKYKYLGINYDANREGWYMREYAPNAWQLYLTGEFNFWNRKELPFVNIGGGVWEIFLPAFDWKERFDRHEKFKITITSKLGEHDRIPVYANYVVQNETDNDFCARLYYSHDYQWKNESPVNKDTIPLIYEAHVGMAQEKEGVGTYKEFEENVLPRIQKLGYKYIQLMAIQEHPYYGSFGYHVSSYFAPSSRSGTPEELKSLIDTAHGMGIGVILDCVHSHAVKNLLEGLSEFDGTELYFHEGDRGYHKAWDSRLFNYGKTEVLQFLLSNLKYWLVEFKFDGFRFDGVTSMLYTDHGLDHAFDNMDAYYAEGRTDSEAITYLQLANTLVHTFYPNAITIAEDVSGFPGLSRPIEEGGIGFNYRLAMGLPDYWLRTVKDQADEEWDFGDMWGTLINRRKEEGTIAYVESHDQALVGDQTLAIRMMGVEMYANMAINHDSIIVDRGLALLKMIRLATIGAGGEGYMNFMGNEFGHPDWIDFPREGNDWSYQYARRQWSLVDSPFLRYHFLNDFDADLIHLIAEQETLSKGEAVLMHIHHDDKVLCFGRGNLLFVFNFSPTKSYENIRFPAPDGYYKSVLNTDSSKYGGFDRIKDDHQYETFGTGLLSLYLPARTALVLMPGKV